MMKLKLFVLVILFVSVSLLIVPDLTHTTVSGQSDKSFKGTTAPFVPPSASERLGSIPGNNFEFDEEEVEGDEGGEEEIDRDELPVLTKQERDEFLSDNIDAIEPNRLPILSQEETIDDDSDPISSIVEEIVKNETIIGDEEFVPSPESSIIKFKDQDLEQILDAQKVAPEADNQTISTTEEQEEELPLNVTEDDFEIEQADEISEDESPNVDVQSFINETANEETPSPTDNETATTTTTDDAVEEEAVTAPTDNETATTTTTDDAVEEQEQQEEDEAQTPQVEEEEEEQEQQEEDEAQTPQVEEEEEQEQQEEDEAQTPQVEEGQQQTEQEQQEEESSNTTPIAQDSSVTASQNQQLNIQLSANDADEDELLFTIVDGPSNGQLGNIDPSSRTITYTPDEDYSGEDNFTFIVNDGTIDSNEATVSITVEEGEQTEQAQQEEDEDSQQEEDEDSQQEEDEDSQQEEDEN
jgi:Bacterial Ig domain